MRCAPTRSSTRAASRSPATRAAPAPTRHGAAVGEVGLRIDVPSVTEGVDIGPEPTPFQQAQQLAAEAWGAQRSWFLINGASQGNHAACIALAHGGNRVVVQRNVHSSVIDGLVLAACGRPSSRPSSTPSWGSPTA